MVRWSCEQLLRHPIFETFLFTVPHTDQEEWEKARRAQVMFLPEELPTPPEKRKGKGKGKGNKKDKGKAKGKK